MRAESVLVLFVCKQETHNEIYSWRSVGYYMRGKKRLLIITLTVFIVLIIMCSVVLPKETVSCSKEMAEPTGLEPATSDVTGRRSNQLNYDSAKNWLVW